LEPGKNAKPNHAAADADIAGARKTRSRRRLLSRQRLDPQQQRVHQSDAVDDVQGYFPAGAGIQSASAKRNAIHVSPR
jgi:hypothetical protein